MRRSGASGKCPLCRADHHCEAAVVIRGAVPCLRADSKKLHSFCDDDEGNGDLQDSLAVCGVAKTTGPCTLPYFLPRAVQENVTMPQENWLHTAYCIHVYVCKCVCSFRSYTFPAIAILLSRGHHKGICSTFYGPAGDMRYADMQYANMQYAICNMQQQQQGNTNK